MITLLKYCGIALFTIVTGVASHAICNNWCPTTTHRLRICCDVPYGQSPGQVYPGIPGYPGVSTYPGVPTFPGIQTLPGIPTFPGTSIPGMPGVLGQSKLYCPMVDCTSNNNTALTNCTVEDDCKRRETCCDNPCTGTKKCFVGRLQPSENINQGCPSIKNCTSWISLNRNATICSTDDDCSRTQVCCQVPCNNTMICQRPTQRTGPRTNTRISIIPQIPGYTIPSYPTISSYPANPNPCGEVVCY